MDRLQRELSLTLQFQLRVLVNDNNLKNENLHYLNVFIRLTLYPWTLQEVVVYLLCELTFTPSIQVKL